MRLGSQKLKLNSKRKGIPRKVQQVVKGSDFRNFSNNTVTDLAEIYTALYKEFELLAAAHQKLIKLEVERLDIERKEILDLANDLFEDEKKTANWLNTPKESLNHQTPLEALATELGTEKVKEMLYRAEYGIFG